MEFEERVKRLTLTEMHNIETHYYAALETSHGSGDHWILMPVLDKYGFRTNSPDGAMNLAEEIITYWYRTSE
ncbi:MAG: hypothetical protein H6662_05120 [Ardenticatenaceae bacterium]|nr:hypothetical protein [Anaerolineales bacterium]MCB8920948.1 hypothetical protein [Ardenticatenaceae bacterium]